MSRPHRKQLVRSIEAERHDTLERVTALRLQAMAWRHLALIAMVDPEWGRKRAQWLLFQTVPFTNGPEIEQFIAETETLAEECGIRAGVFTAQPAFKTAER